MASDCSGCVREYAFMMIRYRTQRNDTWLLSLRGKYDTRQGL